MKRMRKTEGYTIVDAVRFDFAISDHLREREREV